jgi:AcrR family transcriptional regulator
LPHNKVNNYDEENVMVRKKNAKVQNQIEAAIWQLFLTQGYTHTSYANIAAQTQLTRTLIQHYYPHKVLMLRPVQLRVGTAVFKQVEKMYPELNEPLARYYLIRQLYFGVFLDNRQLNQLYLDILENRKLTEASLNSDLSWSMTFLNQQHELTDDDRFQLISSIGGFYQLIYYALTTGKQFDIGHYFSPIMQILCTLSDLSHADYVTLIHTYKIPMQKLSAISTSIFNNLYK